MRKSVDVIRGDAPGTDYSLTVLSFDGRDVDAPSAYLQAALHGNELPGVAALHFLIPMLEKAEAEGRVVGRITVVPYANPIGVGQHHFGEHMGRFALGTRVNFNRDFPLCDGGDLSGMPDATAPVFAEKRLKAHLVRLAYGHDLVLDLHCDDEALPYLYIHKHLWPHMADLASALRSDAVLIWEGSSDAAFEEALIHPYLHLPGDDSSWATRAVSTVELRGRPDVSPDLARSDAQGLYQFLVHRGVIADADSADLEPWSGDVVPLDHVEMAHAPASGAVLYHVKPGDRVATGDLLVSILHEPGAPAVEVRAPQDGLIMTRRCHRFTRPGDDLLKLLGSRPSAGAKAGALED